MMIAGGDGDRALMVDTNVLVYASLPRAPLHGAAQAALRAARDAGTPLWISRRSPASTSGRFWASRHTCASPSLRPT